MKKTVLVIALLALVAVTLVAAHEFPSTLTVINKTEGNVIISLEYPYSFLVVRQIPTKKFTIERDTYDAIVTACGETTNGTMNLEHNLKLNFTPCPAGPNQRSKYLGEPTMEKPNWNREPGVADWRFLY